MKSKYFIKTFGCQQNHADSERITAAFKSRGMAETKDIKKADYIVINTCMVRQSAENRVYGLINNLSKLKPKPKIIVTGCLVGLAVRDKTGKHFKRLKEKLPAVDEFMPIEEVGFDFAPLRTDKTSAWVPISNGCNNFCTFCVVPFTRGREISRPYEEIIKECKELKSRGYRTITLLGQNVNSYGADLIKNSKFEIPSLKQTRNSNVKSIKQKNLEFINSNLFRSSNLEFRISKLKPIYVKHLGRYRIPTLFPHLLEDVAKLNFDKVDFISSNPWDFSDELMEVITRNKNITHTIHLPFQSGDDNVLKRMNRWYSSKEYLDLVLNLKSKILNLKITTDIIVGFCGETEKEFKNTVKLCKKVGFSWAYISIYSPRPMTVATRVMKDDVPHSVKKHRWQILEDLINKPHLKMLK